MDNELQLRRNTESLFYQMGFLIALGLIFMIFATQIFNAVDDLFPADLTWLTRLARWIILIMLIFAILTLRSNKRRVKYSATPDSIIVSRRFLGSVNKDIYAIREVSSVSLRQSFLGSRLNYGDIIVTMNRLGRNETLVLKEIENPEQSLRALENRVKHIRR